MTHSLRTLHRWLWWILAIAALGILVLSVQHRPDYQPSSGLAAETDLDSRVDS